MNTINPQNSQPVCTDEVYYREMDSCPVGQKVILMTLGKVAVFGIVTEKTRGHYLGWHPLMKLRK